MLWHEYYLPFMDHSISSGEVKVMGFVLGHKASQQQSQSVNSGLWGCVVCPLPA